MKSDSTKSSVTVTAIIKSVFKWLSATISSSIILGVLFFIIISFYLFSSIIALNSFFYVFLILSLLTDGLYIFSHIVRKRTSPKMDLSFDPSKLTVVISSYNGEEVIAETVKNAQKHLPNDQIIVISDASTDKTAETAYKAGARVFVNKKNLHKVASIHNAMKFVNTEYVLVLDDDTLIGDTFIPTNLLDEGYSAVAFNVMPEAESSLVNRLQRFEYRLSMQVSKNMRSKKGSVGNVSGAIGLFRAEDIRSQAKLHSGQFAGEDEQRTLLAHLEGKGKGITYTDSVVLTKAPKTFIELYKQRALSWSLSIPELFTIYWRIILSPRFHFLLKADKAYLIYVYLTDPLRILFFWAMILRPQNLLLAYGFYLALNTILWVRLGFKDRLGTIIVMPFYSMFLTACRFVGHFYWFNEKARYLISGKHKTVTGRKLSLEYAFLFLIISATWVVSINHFISDMRLFRKISSTQLSSNENEFNYQESPEPLLAQESVADGKYITVPLEPGDNKRSVAHKAVDRLAQLEPELLPLIVDYDKRTRIDYQLAGNLPYFEYNYYSSWIKVNRGQVLEAIESGSGQKVSDE